jgi:protein MpaA
MKSALNNDIELIDIKPDNFINTVLITGVFHGDEPDGEYLINRFLAESKEKFFNNRLVVIPCLNPDGKFLKTRTNSNKVDINRNFPCRNWEESPLGEFHGGKSPASEIETRFMIDVIEKYKPDIILTIHAPFRTVNFDGPAMNAADKISQITGYPLQKDIGYPTPGSFGTYCGIEQNIPVITLELPEHQPPELLWLENKGVFDYLASLDKIS